MKFVPQFKMNLQLKVLLLFLFGLNFCQNAVAIDSDRSKRAVIYQVGATTTILAALAIPVDIDMPHSYVAINYAANYMNPQNASYFTQPFNRFHEKNKRELSKAPSLISRSSIYKMMIKELHKFGFNGTMCLLSTICEVNSDVTIASHNGVLGSVIQLLFSPSLSTVEAAIPAIFYQAEKHGKDQLCTEYKKKCPHNILDLITNFH